MPYGETRPGSSACRATLGSAGGKVKSDCGEATPPLTASATISGALQYGGPLSRFPFPLHASSVTSASSFSACPSRCWPGLLPQPLALLPLHALPGSPTHDEPSIPVRISSESVPPATPSPEPQTYGSACHQILHSDDPRTPQIKPTLNCNHVTPLLPRSHWVASPLLLTSDREGRWGLTCGAGRGGHWHTGIGPKLHQALTPR